MEGEPLNDRTAQTEPQNIGTEALATTEGSAEPMADRAPEPRWDAVQAEDEGDMWMDNLSDPPVVSGEHQYEADGQVIETSEPIGAPHSDYAAPELQDQGALPGESDDYAPMMDFDDRSDVESRHSDQRPDIERNPDELEDQGPLPGESDDLAPMTEQIAERDDRSDAEDSHRSGRLGALGSEMDNTVDPESFTMIGIESMPSFRTNRNVPTSDPAEIGEGTSLFINKTLDSLRQEIAESDEEEVDILVSRGHTPADSDPEAPNAENPSPPSRRPISQSPVKRSPRNSSRSPGRTESVPGSIVRARSYNHTNYPAQVVHRSSANSPNSNGGNIIADEDSFSDIPDDVLAAAESQEWHGELGPGQEAAWTASFNINPDYSLGPRNDQVHGHHQSSDATPSRPDLSHKDDDHENSQPSTSRSAQTRRASNQTIDRDSPPHSLRSRADSSRLLTPDATTSSSTQSPPAQQIVITEAELAAEDVGSSPPELTSFVEEAEQHVLPSRRSSDTPANKRPEIHAEHVQERHTFAAVLQPALLGGPRPTLSPVVRIGRTLQNILSDPPSPSGASSVLGSPFKGSVRTSSPIDGMAGDEGLQVRPPSGDRRQTQSTESEPQPTVEAPAQSPRKSWAMSFAPLSQIRTLVTHGTSLFTSPQVNVSQDIEDPFGPSSPTLDKTLDNTRNSAFLDRIKQASREGSRPSSRISLTAAVVDDSETRPATDQDSPMRAGLMSPVGKTASRSSDLGHHDQVPISYDGAYDEDADELADDEPAAVLERQRADTRPSEDTILQELDDPEGSVQDDDSEIQEPEQQNAQLPSSTTAQQGQDDPDNDITAREARQKQDEQPLTSPFQSRETEHRVEAAVDMMQLDDAPVDDEEDEDIWAIEADRTASSPQFAASQHDTSNLFEKNELSVDWGTQSTNSQSLTRQDRSPAFTSRRSIRDLPPEDLEEYSLVDLHSGTSAQPSAKKPTPQAPTQSKNVDLSDFFSSSPNFIERQRRAKEASLAKAAAQSVADKSGQVSYPDLTERVEQPSLPSLKSLPPAPWKTTEPLSPAPGISQDARESTARTSSSATPEQARHRVPGQRLTPTQQAPNDAALFESWSVSSKAPTERPPTSEAPSTPRAISPLVRDSSSFETPDLRALPGRAASPSKSCLRSPLKPKTPGRVVEFTSSTISEAAPLQTRRDAQNKIPGVSASNSQLTNSSFPGKENRSTLPHNSGVQASPQRKHVLQIQQQEQAVDSPLSRTRWSRQHWLFLEKLWQEYQDSPLEFQLRHSKAVMASPRQRPSSSLLGKAVTSQGESLELCQPHLDVVDAFKKEVGGWQEEVLVKRLFALLVGTERRRLGLVPSRR